MELHDFLGISGVFLGLYCYARVQWQRDFAKEFSYSLLNLTGSSLIIVSLMHNWNLPSFISNAVWALISVYGVYRCWNYTRRRKAQAALPR